MRRQRSNWRSFRHGLMLAGLPLLAFVGADYLFAPPSSLTSSDTHERPLTIGQRLDARLAAPAAVSGAQRPASRAATSGEGGALQRVADRSQSSPRADDPRSSLVASIQSELRRVGCYAGEADGSWTPRTKVAMKAFNDSVHVNLATDRPDYILLTLLQGHSGKACSRSCGGSIDAAAQCVDKSIEARHELPAAPVNRLTAVSRSGQATTSAATAPAPIASAWSTATTRALAPVTPASRSAASRSPEITAVPAPVEVQRPVARLAPLPGRMAVGAPAAEPSQDASAGPAVAPYVAPVSEPAHRVARSRPASVSRAPAPSSSRRARISRTFVDLSRNSP